MARSKEALLKRALKRGTTLEEQMRRERPSSSTPKTEAVATKASTIMAKTSKVNILKRKPQDYVRAS